MTQGYGAMLRDEEGNRNGVLNRPHSDWQLEQHFFPRRQGSSSIGLHCDLRIVQAHSVGTGAHGRQGTQGMLRLKLAGIQLDVLQFPHSFNFKTNRIQRDPVKGSTVIVSKEHLTIWQNLNETGVEVAIRLEFKYYEKNKKISRLDV
jgi:hypothetical protein